MCGENQQIIQHQNAIWRTRNPTLHLQERLIPPETTDGKKMFLHWHKFLLFGHMTMQEK